MKGNIKKLSVLVIISVIAMFISVAMASADEHHHCKKAIHGKYAFITTGSCLIALQGFNASLQPNGGATGPWFTGPVTYDGVYTFNKDGTGSVTAVIRVQTLYSQGLGAPPDAGAANASFDFNYTVTKSGNITFTMVKGSFEADWTDGPNAPPSPNSKLYAYSPQPWYGVLSPDRKIFYASHGAPGIIDVTSDKENMNPTGIQEICNFVIQGFRIEE
jgi:hypothetical protein